MDDYTNPESEIVNKTSVDSSFSEYDMPSYSDVSNLSLANDTEIPFPLGYLKVLDLFNIVCYIVIFALGLTGNSLVVYVVLMYAKMKTVTNMYILNLAFSDVMFITMLPITATTVAIKHWVFGLVMCKVYFVLCAINIFGSAFNLCVMSADRYLAICHPIRSMKYRTPRIAFCVCMSVWVLCFFVMLPVILYSTTLKNHILDGKFSCRLVWPANDRIHLGEAYVWYTFILGFVIPVFLITVFYIMVIIRLRQVAGAKKSSSNRRSHGRVTRLIFAVVVVYVTCWLPYWCFQIYRIIHPSPNLDIGTVLLLNGFTILSYTNSMLNPLLYAFLSENFRQSFIKAFKCFPSFGKTRAMCLDKSSYPCTSQTYTRAGTSAVLGERVELTAMEDNSVASPELAEDRMCIDDVQDKDGFLKPPTKF